MSNSSSHKYAELTAPQGVEKHSFAQLVNDNPKYQSIDTPTNNVYSPTVFSNGAS